MRHSTNLKNAIFTLILQIDLIRMAQHQLMMSTLVQVMAWCLRAPSQITEPMLTQIYITIWRHHNELKWQYYWSIAAMRYNMIQIPEIKNLWYLNHHYNALSLYFTPQIVVHYLTKPELLHQSTLNRGHRFSTKCLCISIIQGHQGVNTFRLESNGRHLTNNVF